MKVLQITSEITKSKNTRKRFWYTYVKYFNQVLISQLFYIGAIALRLTDSGEYFSRATSIIFTDKDLRKTWFRSMVWPSKFNCQQNL